MRADSGFVSIEPRSASNIKSNTQFIDEIEIDAPVPFNVPIKFDGELTYGEHDIIVTVRYKDSVRDEIFLSHDATIFVQEPSANEESSSDSDDHNSYHYSNCSWSLLDA